MGAATGAVDATAEGAERAAEAAAFPIEGYDQMNVDEILGAWRGFRWMSCRWFATTRSEARDARRCWSGWIAR
jgi:hypothetical protein